MEDDLNFSWKWKRTSISLKIVDDLNFLKMKDNLNFMNFEEALIFLKMKEDLNFLENGRRAQFSYNWKITSNFLRKKKIISKYWYVKDTSTLF